MKKLQSKYVIMRKLSRKVYMLSGPQMESGLIIHGILRVNYICSRFIINYNGDKMLRYECREIAFLRLKCH